MLSFIYSLVNGFESSHGIRPNLLYLNEIHLQRLIEQFDPEYDLFKIMDFLSMEIIIDKTLVHPHVGWSRIMERPAATG